MKYSTVEGGTILDYIKNDAPIIIDHLSLNLFKLHANDTEKERYLCY